MTPWIGFIRLRTGISGDVFCIRKSNDGKFLEQLNNSSEMGLCITELGSRQKWGEIESWGTWHHVSLFYKPVITDKCETFGRVNLSMWNALGMKQDLCGLRPTTNVRDETRPVGYMIATCYQISGSVPDAAVCPAAAIIGTEFLDD